MILLGLAVAASLAGSMPSGADARAVQSSIPQVQWLFDRQARCYVLHTGLTTADGVAWAGACESGRASGAGAALFTYHDGFAEFLSGTFDHGAVDGPVRISLPNGGEFEGQAHMGRLTGTGSITFRGGENRTVNTGPSRSDAVPKAPPSETPTASILAQHPQEERSSSKAPESTLTRTPAPDVPAPQAILVRESQVHPIDPPARETALLTLSEPPRSPSDCLAIESADGEVGFHNRCEYNVRFSYCVAHATRTDVNGCDRRTDVGEVRGYAFAALFGAFGQPDYSVRWIACNATSADSEPRLVRAEPPAGQCLPRRVAAQR